MAEDPNSGNGPHKQIENEAPAAEPAFPTEPFACPYCGQMLGPGCRVCVACKAPIDPARINVPPPLVESVAVEQAPVPLERVRF